MGRVSMHDPIEMWTARPARSSLTCPHSNRTASNIEAFTPTTRVGGESQYQVGLESLFLAFAAGLRLSALRIFSERMSPSLVWYSRRKSSFCRL